MKNFNLHFLEFTKSIKYIIMVFVLTYLSWLGGQYVEAIAPIGLMVLVLIGAYILFIGDDTAPLIPILFSCLFIMGNRLSWDTWPIWIIIIPLVFFACLIIYIVRHKPHITLGKMGLGLIFLMIAGFLPVIRVLFVEPNLLDASKIFFSLDPFLNLFIYLFFLATIKKGNRDYLVKMMIIASVMIGVQLLTKYVQIRSIDAIMADKKVLDLGWGISNDAAIYLNMGIVLSGYYLAISKTVKSLFINLGIFVFLGVCMLLTWSRMGLLSLSIIAIPLFVFILKESIYRKYIIIGICSGAFLLLLGAIIKPDLIVDPIVSMFSKGVNLSGRESLYQFAIELFKEQPLVGYSMFPLAEPELFVNAGIDADRMVVFHSVFYQTIATMGIIGCIALLFHFFQFGKILFTKINLFKIFIIIMISCSLIQSFLDNVYLMAIYMIVLMIFLIIVEKENEEIAEETV